jgi:thiazole synthase ThiGH ThiG subunit
MLRRCSSSLRLLGGSALIAFTAAVLSGCAVVAVTTTAVGLAATGVGLAVDAGVGAAKIAGKAIGATVDAVTPSSGQ